VSGFRPRLRFGLVGAVLVAASVVLLVFALAGCGGSKGAGASTAPDGALDSASGFAGAALPQGVPAPGFTLTDSARRPVSLSDYRGQVVVLAFLSSSCGAPCVLIAQQVRGALDELATPVPVLIVSVDPGADTPAQVRRFLASVSLTGRARFLTAPAAALASVWRAYRVSPLRAGRGPFERSAQVVLLDRGRERVLYGIEQLSPEALAHDIRKLAAR
jgi:protein SCO1/2